MKPLLDGQPAEPLPPTDPRYTEGGAETKVPDVRGRGLNDARSILERAGWKVTTRPEPNRATRGTVVGQDPLGTALPGESVLLNVSTGEVPPPPDPPKDNGNNNGDSGNNNRHNGN
jgi:beta-lactam-binding protein with PASTA domain